MNILFHTNQISERGTEIAIFDYAEGNENIIFGKSFIAVPNISSINIQVLKRFSSRFNILLYNNLFELEIFIKNNKIELLYQIVSGDKEEILTTIIPVFIHCVFSTVHPFGDYYCPISHFLNDYYGTNYPVLPHIVKPFPGIDGNFRKELDIPLSATVFGGYGGKQQFNIDFVKRVVINIAKESTNIYFIFLNFEPFINNVKNIIFLPGNSNIEYKEKFINTCDAMIHARIDGETFGLSIAEFSIKNKPIITWKPDWIHNYIYMIKATLRRIRRKKHEYASAHLSFLGNKAILYHSSADLKRTFLSFNPSKYKNRELDCYSNNFSPEVVMKIFKTLINDNIV